MTTTKNPTDAFGRLRVGNPVTLFDSKQIFDALALLWDDQEVSGAGTSSTYDQDRASSLLAVSNVTAGKRVRQTFQRPNYQPGKSQLFYITYVMGAPATGITRELGSFDDNNGLFLRQTVAGLSVVRRSNVTGSPVDEVVAQSAWNLDKLDGTGQSALTLDQTKGQIFCMDFEWLGIGAVRFGFVIDGRVVYCHQSRNANELAAVYMSTPNNPLRYSIENDGTGAVATFETLCSSVSSEGGDHPLGRPNYLPVGNTLVNANVVGTVYALQGIRLKAAALGARVDVVAASMMGVTSDNFEWTLRLNPTLAAPLVYGDVADSVLQSALGEAGNPSTTTVTAGTILDGGLIKSFGSSGSASVDIDSALHLGSAINGDRDEIVLCAMPYSINLDVRGGLKVRETS